jgi:hypothetical protein
LTYDDSKLKIIENTSSKCADEEGYDVLRTVYKSSGAATVRAVIYTKNTTKYLVIIAHKQDVILDNNHRDHDVGAAYAGLDAVRVQVVISHQ